MMEDFALDRFMPYLLSVTSEAVSGAVARTYQGRFGLKTPEWRVLAVVAGSADGLRQSEVASATRMDKMTISRAVAALAARGLIARGSARPRGKTKTPSRSFDREGAVLRTACAKEGT